MPDDETGGETNMRMDARMGGVRRTATTAGLLLMALLPVAAAISPDATAPQNIPLAITQPLAGIAVPRPRAGAPMVPESGMLILVGSGLFGFAAVVRKATRN